MVTQDSTSRQLTETRVSPKIKKLTFRLRDLRYELKLRIQNMFREVEKAAFIKGQTHKSLEKKNYSHFSNCSFKVILNIVSTQM